MSDADRTIFISRAGADKALAIRIAAALKGAGYRTVLQDEDFGHTSFMAMMHDTLASGARVAALLSQDYLASVNCGAEWQAALTGDPQNVQQRLIVFRVRDCAPTGLLKPIPYVNLVPLHDDPVALSRTVLDAVARASRIGEGAAATHMDPDTIWDVPSFTGRDEELGELRRALFAEGGMAAVTQPAAVHGMGGVGKSALAREYARRNRDDYSILWWLNAETEDGIVGGLIRLGARFTPGLDQEQDRTKAARFALERVFAPLPKPALLVFDNVESQALLRRWKPAGNCHLLVTSRVHGWGGGFKAIEIKQLPPDDAREYLLRESARSDIAAADAGDIAAALGYLPLALAHAAATLRDSPAMTARSYLARIEALMKRVPDGAEYGRAVYATLQEALQKAERRAPGAAAILCAAAFYAPDDIPFELLEQDAKIYPDDLAPCFHDGIKAASLRAALDSAQSREDALSALAALSLVTLNNETRDFSMHRLLQAACKDLLGADLERWQECAVSIIDKSYPSGEFDTWRLCERLTAHAEIIAESMTDAGSTNLSGLVGRLGYYLRQRALYSRAAPLYRRALALDEERYGTDHSEVATRLNNLALMLQTINQDAEAEALMRRALAISETQLGSDHPDMAARLNNLAHLLQATRRFTDAEPLMRRALALDEANFGANHPDVARDLNNLAQLLKNTGRSTEAEPLMRRALAINEECLGPNHPRVATGLVNLATLLRDANCLAEAEPLMRRALAIDEAIFGSDHPEVAVDLDHFAALLLDTDRVSEAISLYERAVKIFLASLGPDHPNTKIVSGNLDTARDLLARQNRSSP